MHPAMPMLALLAAAAPRSEIAWWEGRWADRGASCADRTRDDGPMTLAWNRLQLGEAECGAVREQPAGRHGLRLRATCREHGDPISRPRTFTLAPSNGGRTMTMSDGSAVWHLRKCR